MPHLTLLFLAAFMIGQPPTPHSQAGESAGDERLVVINANYELFVLALVLLSIVNSVALRFTLGTEQRRVIVIINLCISIFLILDAIIRFVRALNKRRFLVTLNGWLYFVGSLPIPFFGLFRLLQTGLMARTLRRSDYSIMGQVVVKRRAQSTLLMILLAVILVLELGAILILRVEQGTEAANIKTASDALWWGIVTVATIGYGDRYPVSNEGRVVGVFMIVAGVALFSAITSFLAQWFLTPRRASRRASRLPQVQTPSPADQIAPLRQLLQERETANQEWMAEMEARLSALEDALKPH